MVDSRRATPRTDSVLADPRLKDAAAHLGRTLTKSAVTRALDRCRAGEIAPDEVVDVVLASLPHTAGGMRPVINATGILVHTNLGRAPLSAAAVEAVVAASGPTDVELDLESGRRARRGRSALDALAAAVPHAEAVHVVNNGAAALALVASALAGPGHAGPRPTGGAPVDGPGPRGGGARNAVIARGEMVEIGDGFRIPELVESVGLELREVGTTNRVRLDDYQAAVDDDTAFVLKVHPSNFQVTGFTSTVAVGALATLPVPVVADIGSGLLVSHPRLPDEPSASAALAAGAALVTASGDKLLGGPQCGLLLGRAALVERARRHPLARAMRVDKLTLAALEATLAGPPPPVTRALATTQAELLARARRLAADLMPLVEAVAEESEAAVGGGGAPGVVLPSAAVRLPAELARPLRLGTPPVVGRVERGRLLLDLLTVPSEQDDAMADAVRRAVGPVGGED